MTQSSIMSLFGRSLIKVTCFGKQGIQFIAQLDKTYGIFGIDLTGQYSEMRKRKKKQPMKTICCKVE